jgi:RNA polymerase sigma-70 factor, ECF subfamily
LLNENDSILSRIKLELVPVLLYDSLDREGTLERYSFDVEYVRLLKGGDPATQQHFIRYFGDHLSIKLRGRLRSSHLVEEVRQETFLRVFTILKRDGLDHPERLGSFVNSVCNNVLFEMFRAESRNPNLPEDTPEPPDLRPGPDSSLETVQQKDLVQKILGELPVKDRELIRMIFLEERDKDDVCRDFKVDREYLRVLLHRAKSRFRAVLEEHHPHAHR